MREMISKLTPEQESKIPQYFAKWRENGLKTSKLDREKARQAVEYLYRTYLGKEPPRVLFFSSPMQCELAANIYPKLKGISQLISQLDTQLHSELDTQLISQLSSELSKLKTKYFNYCYYSWYWAGYYCFYDFVQNELLPEKVVKNFKETIDALFQLGFFIPFDGVCYVSENPVAIRRQERPFRLHNPKGKSLEWSDEYGLYALRGVAVPDWVIEKKTPEKIFTELKNAEQKRVAIEHYGLEAVYEHMDAQVLDRAELFGDQYELLSLTFEGEKTGPWLKMTCPSTGRVYIECTPRGPKDSQDPFDDSVKTVKMAYNKRVQSAFGWRNVRLSKTLQINT